MGAGFSRSGYYGHGRLTRELRGCCSAAHALVLARARGAPLPSVEEAEDHLSTESTSDDAARWMAAGGASLLCSEEGVRMLRSSLLDSLPPVVDEPPARRWLCDVMERRLRYKSDYYNALISVSNASRSAQPTGVVGAARISFSSLAALGYHVAPQCVASHYAARVAILSPGRTGTISVLSALYGRDEWVVAPFDAPERMHGSEVPADWSAVVLLTPPLQRARSALTKLWSVRAKPSWAWMVEALGGAASFVSPETLLDALVLHRDEAGTWALLRPQQQYLDAARRHARCVRTVVLRREHGADFGGDLQQALLQLGVEGLEHGTFARKHASEPSAKSDVSDIRDADFDQFLAEYWPEDKYLCM